MDGTIELWFQVHHDHLAGGNYWNTTLNSVNVKGGSTRDGLDNMNYRRLAHARPQRHWGQGKLDGRTGQGEENCQIFITCPNANLGPPMLAGLPTKNMGIKTATISDTAGRGDIRSTVVISGRLCTAAWALCRSKYTWLVISLSDYTRTTFTVHSLSWLFHCCWFIHCSQNLSYSICYRQGAGIQCSSNTFAPDLEHLYWRDMSLLKPQLDMSWSRIFSHHISAWRYISVWRGIFWRHISLPPRVQFEVRVSGGLWWVGQPSCCLTFFSNQQSLLRHGLLFYQGPPIYQVNII